jgi:hypothetical protein
MIRQHKLSLISAIHHEVQSPNETEGESRNNQKSKSDAIQKGSYMGNGYTVAYALIKVVVSRWKFRPRGRKRKA